MKLTIIAAEAANKVIGNNGTMPWHIPEDLKHFKHETAGSAVIMGRKTFESLDCKPLPHRTNVIVSKTSGAGDTFHVVRSLKSAVKSLIVSGHEEAYVIGGAQLYNAAMPWASRIILSKLYKSYEGDTVFPDIDPLQWAEYDKIDVFSATQPFTIHKYTNVNQPDVAKWVDLIKD